MRLLAIGIQDPSEFGDAVPVASGYIITIALAAIYGYIIIIPQPINMFRGDSTCYYHDFAQIYSNLWTL